MVYLTKLNTLYRLSAHRYHSLMSAGTIVTNVSTNVTVGVIVGRIECSYSCTSPPVIDASVFFTCKPNLIARVENMHIYIISYNSLKIDDQCYFFFICEYLISTEKIVLYENKKSPATNTCKAACLFFFKVSLGILEFLIVIISDL